MAPNRCAYTGCDSKSNQTKLFRFPAKDKERLKAWVLATGNENLLKLDNDVLYNRFVCNKHFDDKQFMNARVRTKLKPKVVPRKYAPTSLDEVPTFSSKGQLLTYKKAKECKRKMQEVMACAVCLSTDESTLQDMKSELLLYYYLITGLQLDSEKGMPRHLCYECASLLRKSNMFRDKCHRSFRIMNELILKSNNKLTQEDIVSIDREDNRLTSHLNLNDHPAITYSGPLEDIDVVKHSLSPSREDDFKFEINFDDGIQIKLERNNSDDDAGTDNNDVMDWIQSDQIKVEENGIQSDQIKIENDITTEVPEAEEDINVINTTCDENVGTNIINDSKKTIKTNSNENKIITKVPEAEEDLNISDTTCGENVGNIINESRKTRQSNSTQNKIIAKVPEAEEDMNESDSTCDEYVGKIIKKIRKTRNSNNKEKKIKLPRKKKKRKTRPSLILNYLEEFVKVVELSHEEQLEELRKRKESDSYKNSPYKCENCCKGFIEQGTYNNHMHLHNPLKGDVECDVCKKYFSLPKQLKRHMILHSTKYECKLCVHTSYVLSSALAHYNSKHKGVVIKCRHCDMTFPTNPLYLGHLRSNHPSTQVCELCGFTFVSEMGLRQHKSKIHPNLLNDPASVVLSGPSCAVCDVTFVTRKAYDRHLTTSGNHVPSGKKAMCYDHSKKLIAYKSRPYKAKVQSAGAIKCEQPPAQCDVCGELKGRQHYQCDLCQKMFPHKANLKRHIEIHANLQLPCPHCRKIFTCRNNLWMHVRHVHQGKPWYKRKLPELESI